MSPSIEFWSSVELGTFARGLLRELTAIGWSSEQHFAVDEEGYRTATGLEARFRLRWRSYVCYPWTLHRRLQEKTPPDALVVCTNTFYAPAVAVRAARKAGVPVVHWVFDLFPDVLVLGGEISAGGLRQRYLSRITRSIFTNAAVNVFLGDRLLQHATREHGPIRNGVVIPVGADGQMFRTAMPQSRPSSDPLRILYCGNLGRMHDTQTVLDFLRQPSESGWALEFRGHGVGFRALAAATAELGRGRDVTFGVSLDDAQWAAAMVAADVALVTMRRGAEGLVMPSKTYSAMMAGQAILAVCPGNSDLADTVRRHDAGWVVEPGDVEGLRAIISEAARQPNTVLMKRRNAFRAGHRHYSQETVAALWGDLLTSIDVKGGIALPAKGTGEQSSCRT